jgi:hypothetical protein
MVFIETEKEISYFSHDTSRSGMFLVFPTFTHDAKFERNGLVSFDTSVTKFRNRSTNNFSEVISPRGTSLIFSFSKTLHLGETLWDRYFTCPCRRISTEI